MPDDKERNIIALAEVPPETMAYAMARYSRSPDSIEKSIGWINEQSASGFLESFYFKYGHKSIADMAHIPLALENISVLAAIEVEHERLWDGQERSTRYQDFSKSGFVVPSELDYFYSQEAKELYLYANKFLLKQYENVKRDIVEAIKEFHKKPDSVKELDYNRTVNAKALDVARSLLPHSVKTSVGQITSARTLEKQISRLATSPYSEVREISSEMEQACRFKPVSYRAVDDVRVLWETGYLMDEEAAEKMRQLLSHPGPVAPTLIKYIEADKYRKSIEDFMRPVAKYYMRDFIPNYDRGVMVFQPEKDAVVEAVATMLFRYSQNSYSQCRLVSSEMCKIDRLDIFNTILKMRGQHDEWPSEFDVGHNVIVDISADSKSMQDLFRHRNCIQIRQDLTRAETEGPDAWFRSGLPGDVYNSLTGTIICYKAYMEEAYSNYDKLLAMTDSKIANYILPMANNRKALFKMTLKQAAYMIETRSTPKGHFSYRDIVGEMLYGIEYHYKDFADNIRVKPVTEADFFTR